MWERNDFKIKVLQTWQLLDSRNDLEGGGMNRSHAFYTVFKNKPFLLLLIPESLRLKLILEGSDMLLNHVKMSFQKTANQFVR